MPENITERQFEIIEAAGKILTSSGVSGLTIKNLAKEMGFSEAAIYRHFGSKEKIVISMLEYLASTMDERDTISMNNDHGPEEQFVKLFQNQFSFFNANPHFVVAVFSDGLMEASERINATILKIMAVKKKHLLPIIVKGQKESLFTDAIAAEALMHIVMGTMRLLMYKWRVANFDFDILKEGDKMIQSLLTVLKNKE